MGCHTRHYFYSAKKQKEWKDFVVRSFREMTQKGYDGLSEESVKENFDFYHSLYIRSVSSAKEFLNAYNNPEKRQELLEFYETEDCLAEEYVRCTALSKYSFEMFIEVWRNERQYVLSLDDDKLFEHIFKKERNSTYFASEDGCIYEWHDNKIYVTGKSRYGDNLGRVRNYPEGYFKTPEDVIKVMKDNQSKNCNECLIRQMFEEYPDSYVVFR